MLQSLQGTSDEVALLVAEFALLDGPIAALAEDVEKGEAGRINEDDLARLAVEIPDLRMRLGIGCAHTWPIMPITWRDAPHLQRCLPLLQGWVEMWCSCRRAGFIWS